MHSVITLSTTEDEYMTLSESLKEALWMTGLVRSLGLKDQTSIFCDSPSAIDLFENQMYHERTKHIDVRFYFVRDSFSLGDMAVQKVDVKDNPTNIFTKPVSISMLKHCLVLVDVLNG